MQDAINWERIYSEISVMLDDESKHKEAYSKYKAMSKAYINQSVDKGYCYDHVNVDNLIALAKRFPISFRINLLKYIKRELTLALIEYDNSKLDEEIRKTRTWCGINEGKFSASILLDLISYNCYIALIVLALSILAMSNAFISTNYKPLQLFKCESIQMADNERVNAVLNLIGYLLIDTDAIKIQPTNAIGLTAIILSKAFILIVVLNYLSRRIIDSIGDSNAH